VITDSFSSCIAKLTATMDSKFEVKFDSLAFENFALSSKVERLERKVDELSNSNTALSLVK